MKNQNENDLNFNLYKEFQNFKIKDLFRKSLLPCQTAIPSKNLTILLFCFYSS